MPHDSPLNLTVAQPGDFRCAGRILLLLVVIAAGLSPYPVFMAIMACAWCYAVVRACPAYFTRQIRGNPSVAIFPDGRISLHSGRLRIVEGALGEHHWCTRRGAVLAIRIQDSVEKLVFLARQQNPDDFRRLQVWLRQGQGYNDNNRERH